MNHDLVAIGIENDGEATDRRVHGFRGKFHAARFQPRDLGIQIVHFQRDARSVWRRLPDITVAADAQSSVADFVFDPHAAGGFHRRFEAEHAFIKFARAFVFRDWRAGECDFGDHNLGNRSTTQVAREKPIG